LFIQIPPVTKKSAHSTSESLASSTIEKKLKDMLIVDKLALSYFWLTSQNFRSMIGSQTGLIFLAGGQIFFVEIEMSNIFPLVETDCPA